MRLTLELKYYSIYICVNQFNLRHFLFNIVMATVPIALQITASLMKIIELISDTNLSVVNTEDELHTNVSTWTPAERKKVQHMMEFMQNISVYSVKRLPSQT